MGGVNCTGWRRGGVSAPCHASRVRNSPQIVGRAPANGGSMLAIGPEITTEPPKSVPFLKRIDGPGKKPGATAAQVAIFSPGTW